VALFGTFGYELDITQIPDEERMMIPEQTAMYHKYNDLIRTGDYYRIASYRENRFYDLAGVVSKDKSEALYIFIQVMGRPNHRSRIIKLKGLNPLFDYRIEESGEIIAGDSLLNGGFVIPQLNGDFQGKLIYLQKI